MQEFFAQRRQERAQENELLQDRLEDAQNGVDVTFENKEWIAGNVLDSLAFFKQVSSRCYTCYAVCRLAEFSTRSYVGCM